MSVITGRYWVLDTEGSGQKPNLPIQLAAVEMDGLKITGKTRLWHFKPPTPVSYHATRVHGITNRDISRHPTFAEQRDDVVETLGDLPIIGHAVDVELHGIRQLIPEWTPQQDLCTYRMARRLYPAQMKHKLTFLTEQFGLAEDAAAISQAAPHHALYDATATALLFRYFAQTHADRIPSLIKAYDLIAGERTKAARAELSQRRRALKQQARALNKSTSDISNAEKHETR